MQPVVIRTERLVLDLPVPADADVVTRACQDPLFESVLTTPWPYERRHADAFLGEHVPKGWATGGELTWAIRANAGDPLVGMISVRETQNEIGFWMVREHRGAGVMSEAATAVAEWVLAGGIAGASTVFWRAVVGNTGSAKVARAAGFRHIRPADSLVPDRDGNLRPAWFGVREAIVDPRAESSWNEILGPRA
ncbi:RimJ/RimL family protein N-acetyltransferase [Agromyces terreus]|uniref:RimJ/RimL family protein N-acetyltransferase n=1 Tax=Agromyces terreus TaxID=424795 RepID=A0A9X2GZ27_9MICO|nr:GNAT family N-acetyltransferase [Agromyces terreus]MCP2371242.1 RimJ/RimL family protein N-acetyltransferase [Agromyces terreus]